MYRDEEGNLYKEVETRAPMCGEYYYSPLYRVVQRSFGSHAPHETRIIVTPVNEEEEVPIDQK